MTDPITSEYDTTPFDPDAEPEGNESPPELGNTDSPKLEVAWDEHRSFNDPPKKPENEENGGSFEEPGSADFSIHFEVFGDQLNGMLTRARSLVAQYESLRKNVLASEATVFGQNSQHPGGEVKYYSSEAHQWMPFDRDPSPTVFTEPAKKFAEEMNPVQEKTLQSIGATLELVGEYIALANYSAQMYAEADRRSRFPPPPASA